MGTANSLFMKSGWITANAPSKNGVGRFVPQLARITIKFCKEFGHSNGVRQYIQQDVVQFAKHNPSCVVYLKPRRHRSPVIVAEFLNGQRQWQSLKGFTCEEVGAWVDYYRTHSGREFMDQFKMHYTDHASIQGYWHPYTHTDPAMATATFPDSGLGLVRNQEPTASDTLLSLYEQQKLRDSQGFSVGEEERLAGMKQGVE